jgi:hypothetical protein
MPVDRWARRRRAGIKKRMGESSDPLLSGRSCGCVWRACHGLIYSPEDLFSASQRGTSTNDHRQLLPIGKLPDVSWITAVIFYSGYNLNLLNDNEERFSLTGAAHEPP